MVQTLTSKATLLQAKSERVVRLLATCIRVAIGRNHNQEIAPEEALQLARVYELPSALRAIEEALTVHENLPGREMRFRLAVAEAIVAGGIGGDPNAVIKLRRAWAEQAEASRQAEARHRTTGSNVASVQYGARQWERAYSRFLAEIGELSGYARNEINALALSPARRAAAHLELESIISNAITRAGRRPRID